MNTKGNDTAGNYNNGKKSQNNKGRIGEGNPKNHQESFTDYITTKYLNTPVIEDSKYPVLEQGQTGFDDDNTNALYDL